MTKLRRPHMPLTVKLAVALRQLGLDPTTAECDHDPALALRKVTKRDEEGRAIEFDPPANDPRYLVWLPPAGHKHKTTGRKPGAERTATTLGSDAHAIAKAERLAADQAEFRRMLLRPCGQKREKSGKIKSRGFRR